MKALIIKEKKNFVGRKLEFERLKKIASSGE